MELQNVTISLPKWDICVAQFGMNCKYIEMFVSQKRDYVFT